MTDTKKNDRCRKTKWFVIGSALTLVGFIIVPFEEETKEEE